LGDRVPLNEKARAEQLIIQIRELVKNNSSDIARLRQLTGDLQQVGYGIGSASSGQQSSESGRPEGARGEQQGGRSGDDVIDAEFTEK
jgi:molecular chaperone DnaK